MSSHLQLQLSPNANTVFDSNGNVPYICLLIIAIIYKCRRGKYPLFNIGLNFCCRFQRRCQCDGRQISLWHLPLGGESNDAVLGPVPKKSAHVPPGLQARPAPANIPRDSGPHFWVPLHGSRLRRKYNPRELHLLIRKPSTQRLHREDVGRTKFPARNVDISEGALQQVVPISAVHPIAAAHRSAFSNTLLVGLRSCQLSPDSSTHRRHKVNSLKRH